MNIRLPPLFARRVGLTAAADELANPTVRSLPTLPVYLAPVWPLPGRCRSGKRAPGAVAQSGATIEANRAEPTGELRGGCLADPRRRQLR